MKCFPANFERRTVRYDSKSTVRKRWIKQNRENFRIMPNVLVLTTFFVQVQTKLPRILLMTLRIFSIFPIFLILSSVNIFFKIGVFLKSRYYYNARRHWTIFTPAVLRKGIISWDFRATRFHVRQIKRTGTNVLCKSNAWKIGSCSQLICRSMSTDYMRKPTIPRS